MQISEFSIRLRVWIYELLAGSRLLNVGYNVRMVEVAVVIVVGVLQKKKYSTSKYI